jgi:hypothetical protein
MWFWFSIDKDLQIVVIYSIEKSYSLEREGLWSEEIF